MRETSVVPWLVVDRLDRAVAFYRRALGAEELRRIDTGDGAGLAELRLGQGRLVVVEAAGEPPGTAVLEVAVADADAACAAAVAAGAELVERVGDRPRGGRAGVLRDPFGQRWRVAAPPARRRRGRALFG